MIIINLTGGLGNQMFQYALGRHLSIKLNTELKIHFTNFIFCTQRQLDLNCFKIELKQATKEDFKKIGVSVHKNLNRILFILGHYFHLNIGKNIYTENGKDFDKNVLKSGNNTYLQGYWQNEKYFIDIEDQIRKDFSFKDIKNIDNRLINLIKSTNSCSLHVRRGDYLTYNNFHICGQNYYRKAIHIIKKKVKKPLFFIFSDDIDWCKKNLNVDKNTIFISGNKAFQDMHYMSLCKNNIIANSTFSWWGAWLNSNKNKVVITPNIWFKNTSRILEMKGNIKVTC